MSFYFMYDAKQTTKLLKIGYMSTTNIQQIVSRYATGCGYDIIVYQFLDSEPKVMESKFKEHFRKHHIELEFYDASHHYEYLHWCLNYTKVSPVIGYGKLKCVSPSETKSTGTQCESLHKPSLHTDIGTQCDFNQNGSVKPMERVDNELKWWKTDERHVKCLKCETVLLRCKFVRHEKTCKGVPLDRCKYCLKHCVSNTAKYKHQQTCKKNPANF